MVQVNYPVHYNDNYFYFVLYKEVVCSFGSFVSHLLEILRNRIGIGLVGVHIFKCIFLKISRKASF